MIKVQERITKKVPGITSIFFGFPFNKELFTEIQRLPCSNYSKRTKLWEVPIKYMAQTLDILCQYDDLELDLCDIHFEEDKKYKLHRYKTKPFPYQEEGIQFGLNNDSFLLLDPPGLGKAFTLDTPVLTDNGFQPISNINIGDTVFDEQGKRCTVTNVYNHTSLNMYKVTFSDNTTVNCCEDHLWQVRYKKDVWHKETKTYTKEYITEVRPLKWLIEQNRSKSIRYQTTKFMLPICKPIHFTKRCLPLHPYILGILLGDGNITNKVVNFTSADPFVVDKINGLLPKGYICKHKSKYNYRIVHTDNERYIQNKRNTQVNYISKVVKDLGLRGTNSHTKFIPDIYKYSDTEDRLELLRGLLDSDGYASKDNLLQYTSVSKQLAADVKFVAQSLGGVVNEKEKPCGYKVNETYKHTGFTTTLTIRHPEPQTLVSLPRKCNRLQSRKFIPRKFFKNIEYIGKQAGKCLTVNSPNHLFIVKDCIVTHNTLQLTYIAEELHSREKLEHCLIICGINTLKTNWKKEIQRHSKLDCRILGERTTKKGKVIYGGIQDRLKQLQEPIKEFFVIVNIETLRDPKIIKEILKGKNKFDMIVVDEIHKCKNAGSLQGANLLKLTKAKHRIGATGTLLMNSPFDCYVPLNWIDADRSTEGNFKKYYSVYGGQFGNDFIGYRNLDTLKKQLELYSLRRPKSLLNLPDKNIINEYVDMSDQQRKFYENIVNGVKDEVDKVVLKPSVVLGMVLRLRQATACPSILTTQPIPSAKMDRVCDLVEEITSDGHKVVIFSTFKETVHELEQRLPEYQPLIGTGDIDDEIISNNVDRFQNDPDKQVFIGTWQKCGTGLTLTAATHMIFLDTPWTAAAFEQACDRIYRIGTTEPVFIYNLITTDTIDERVRIIIEDKEALSDYVIDDLITQKGLESLQKYIEDLRD